MTDGDVDPKGSGDPQKPDSNTIRKRIFLGLLAATCLILGIYIRLPEGTLGAWECRYFGPCAQMNADGYGYWKCQHTGEEHMRRFCVPQGLTFRGDEIPAGPHPAGLPVQHLN